MRGERPVAEQVEHKVDSPLPAFNLFRLRGSLHKFYIAVADAVELLLLRRVRYGEARYFAFLILHSGRVVREADLKFATLPIPEDEIESAHVVPRGPLSKRLIVLFF